MKHKSLLLSGLLLAGLLYFPVALAHLPGSLEERCGDKPSYPSVEIKEFCGSEDEDSEGYTWCKELVLESHSHKMRRYLRCMSGRSEGRSGVGCCRGMGRGMMGGMGRGMCSGKGSGMCSRMCKHKKQQ